MTLVYDGVPFDSFGLRAICEDPFVTAKKAVRTTHIDGRNGDLHTETGEFENVEITYLCIASQQFKRRFAEAKAWLGSLSGYKRLEDPIYPDEYRMAAYLSTPGTKPSSKDPNSFEITFNCKPQRFLKSGDIPITLGQSTTIYNPTHLPANPRIDVSGTGTIKINDQIIQINGGTNTIIDGEEMEATAGGQNANSYVSLPERRIELAPGVNTISISEGMTAEIYPRWWTL